MYIPKEKIYYELIHPAKKNIYGASLNTININNRSNNPINLSKFHSIDSYSTFNSITNSEKKQTKFCNIIKFSKRPRIIKREYNNYVNKLSVDSHNDNNPNNHKIYRNCLSPKVILNKSLLAHSLHKKMDFDSFYNNDNNSILKKKILKKLNDSIKRQKPEINENKYETNIKDNLSYRNIRHNYIRKPLVIKVQKDININNIYNNSNIYNNNNISNYDEAETFNNKSLTERRTKRYDFNTLFKKPELFRNFEDLEKKSLEISKRKMLKKKFIIRKDNNLIDIKLSLDAIRKNSKNKLNNKLKTPKINNIKKSKIIYTYSNKNRAINNIKKIFIIQNNNKKHFNDKTKLNQTLSVTKKYIEDTNPQNVINLSITRTPKELNSDFKNKRNNYIKKILPSISEEDDKIKLNIIHLVNILEKIIENKNTHMKKDSMTKLKQQKKINKKINVVYKRKKLIDDHIYNKKFITKNINENIRKKKFVNIYNTTSLRNNYKNKLEKSIELFDNLRVKLIEFSLKDDYN